MKIKNILVITLYLVLLAVLYPFLLWWGVGLGLALGRALDWMGIW